MTSQFSDMTSTSIFWRCFVSLVKFSYWSKIHVNIITVSGIMTIFFYKGLTRNPEIGNTSVWVLPNIWRLVRVMDTKFGTNVSNRMLLNAAKFQGYSFYRLWVIQGKPTWGVKLPPIQIRVNPQKNKNLSKEIYITLMAICSVIAMSFWTGFYPLFNVYFNDM